MICRKEAPFVKVSITVYFWRAEIELVLFSGAKALGFIMHRVHRVI